MRVFYFGCRALGDLGHHLFLKGGEYKAYDVTLPFRAENLDGLLPPNQPQSTGALFYLLGFTILCVADYSADKRAGSNAAFIFEGVHGLLGVKELAKEHFPKQFARIEAARTIRVT